MAAAVTMVCLLAGSASAVGVTTERAVAPPSTRAAARAESPAVPHAPFPDGGRADYQLGVAYRPGDGVSIVARDSTSVVSPGRYNLCYVNGFQTQPGELGGWPRGLLLHRAGRLVHDPGWPGEVLLDTRTPMKRSAILRHQSAVLTRCARAGFDALDLDNLDSWTRSRGALSRPGNVALARGYADAAHALGLSAGQKNTPQLGTVGRDHVGFDFAVAEECVQYAECGAYTRVYGRRVMDVEYVENSSRSFAALCAVRSRPARTVLRDVNLTGPRSPQHVARPCPVT